MFNTLEIRSLILENGFPSMSPVEAEAVFRYVLEERKRERVIIGGLKIDPVLRQKIAADLTRRINAAGTYNTAERAFVARVSKQGSNLPHGYSELFSDKIIPFANQVPGKRVLEIGFGEGEYFPFFDGWDYVGLETSYYAIWRARQEASCKGKTLKITEDGKPFTLEDCSRDFIVALNSMHRIKNWELELEECVRILPVGGRMSIVERTSQAMPFDTPNIEKFDPDYNKPAQIADYLSRKSLDVQTESYHGTFCGEALFPDGFFGFAHVKAIKK